MGFDFFDRHAGDEADRVNPFARKLDQDDARVVFFIHRNIGLEEFLDDVVNDAGEGNPSDDAVPPPNEEMAEIITAQNADDEDHDERKNDTQSPHMETENKIGVKLDGNHPKESSLFDRQEIVEIVDEEKKKLERDDERNRDDHADQEITPQRFLYETKEFHVTSKRTAHNIYPSMAGKSLTYSKAGVSVSRGDRLVDLIAPLAKRTERAEVMASVGGFAALSRLPRKYRSPVLVTSTDGVGTKVLFAKEMKKFDTVGIDLVAMSVNDILTLGAEPLVFLDYFATGHLNLRMGRDLIAGVAAGCRQAGCALVGGETAEMPKVYRSGDFDLAGFCVGVVESNGIIDGQKVRPGDAIVGWPSSGVHSNGYSLVRAVLKRNGLSLRSRPAVLNGKTLGEELLRPTRIYVREILSLMKKVRIKAMAHITGGGIEGNLPRVFPRGTSAEIDRSAWKVPPIFRYLQERGRITDREMYRTFNMGVGFIFVVGRSDLSRALRLSAGAREIGRVIPAPGEARVSWR